MRHGEAENNVLHVLAGREAGYHLTERGKTQVTETAERLKTVPIDVMYTSPVVRTIETAQIVAEKIGIDYKIDERLTETEMGSVVGISTSDVLKKFGNLFLKFYQDDYLALEKMGIERFSTIGARMRNMLDYVAEKHPDKNVLLVTHLDPIKSVISQIMNLKPEVVFKMAIKNASLTILKHSSKDYTLSAYNIVDVSRYTLE